MFEQENDKQTLSYRAFDNQNRKITEKRYSKPRRQQFGSDSSNSSNTNRTYHNPSDCDQDYDDKYNDGDLSQQVHLKYLKSKTIEELITEADSLGVEDANILSRKDLFLAILKKHVENNKLVIYEGVLEIKEGYGFLRSPDASYLPGHDDVYVSPNQIKRFSLRTGDTISGQIRAPKVGEKYLALMRIVQINFLEPQSSSNRVHFDNLTPLYPTSKFNLEYTDPSKDLSMRVLEIVSPFGMGQRALIVAPPRTGKTILLQHIATAISKNHPEVYLIVLLIDERPEEVTDMVRSVKGEVVSSTFDEPAYRHVQLAEIVLEKAKRLVESKKDVVILLDSITRLARAYNTTSPSSGKVLSGGVDAGALQRPKRIFGAARNVEQGGSLTIIGTALVDTGSKMDEVIFEEFKGTGNAELVLDRKLAEKRMFPAIDINKSGTRKDDLLLKKNIHSKIWILRRILPPTNHDALEFLLGKLSDSENNEDFFAVMGS